MKNHTFIALSLLAAFLVVSCGEKKTAPNILFIFTDDHCEQALSAYGSKIIHTPNMDRIAHEGMRFTRCYVTNSICAPSRAVIQTGKYSHLNGILTNQSGEFNGDQQTFPKILQAGGYQTAVIGKWHLGSVPQGYDHFCVLKGQGSYNDPAMRTRDTEGNVTEVKFEGYTTDVITDLTLDWLKNRRDQDKPFMVMCQHKAPHRKWVPHEKYQNWLDDVTIPEPETFWDDYSGRTPPASRNYMEVGKHLGEKDLKLDYQGNYAEKNEAFRKASPHMTEKEIISWKYQRYVKDYLRCVRSVDDGIGQILDYLEQSGLDENTIVVYSSDQGWYLGEHGWFDKRWMYEESLKTPLLVRWPGEVRAGSVCEEIVSNVDFAETFIDMAGIPVPAEMQGASLVPLLEGNTPDDWREYFYYHYYHFPGGHSVPRHYGVTNGKYKLIHFYGPSHVKKGDQRETYDEWELFDLEKDPHELLSVYDDPAYMEIRQELKTELYRLQEELLVPEDAGPDWLW